MYESIIPSPISDLKKLEEEENKMKTREIVELYFDKCKQNLYEETIRARDRITEWDANVIALNKLMDEMKTITETVNPGHLIIKEECLAFYYTEETIDKLNALSEKEREELANLNSDNIEVLTMLSGCETYEQEMTILKAYNIVTNDLILATPREFNIEV